MSPPRPSSFLLKLFQGFLLRESFCHVCPYLHPLRFEILKKLFNFSFEDSEVEAKRVAVQVSSVFCSISPDVVLRSGLIAGFLFGEVMQKRGLTMMNALCKKEAYSIVFPTVLFSLSQIVIHSILPQVVVELVCLQDSAALDCDSSEVSGKASLVNLASSCAINIPCIFLIGFYASFANKYGLKPTLLSPVIGNFIFLGTIVISRWTKSYFSVLMVGSLLSGLSGGRNSFMMATFAYAADVSTPGERSEVFSVIESSIYCAKILCPFTIGALSKKFGFELSLGMAMFVCVFNVVWIVFAMKDPILDRDSPSVQMTQMTHLTSLDSATSVLSVFDDGGPTQGPNSRSRSGSAFSNLDSGFHSGYGSGSCDDNSESKDGNNLNIARTINSNSGAHRKLTFHPFATFHSVANLWGRNSVGNATVPFISGVYFLYHMIAVGVHVVEILFVKYRMGWDPFVIGLFGSMHGVMEITSMLVAPTIALHILGINMTDLNWIEIGLWARALFFCFFGFATQTFELFLILPILILCGPVVPRIRSYLSKSVNPQQQNELFAALAALDAISAFLSPIFTATYFKTVSYFSGFVFEIIAIIFVLSALVILFVRKGFGKDILDYLPISDIP